MTDLTAILREGVTTAILALGTLPKDIEYHAVSVGAYSVETDTQSLTDTVLTVKGVVYKSKVETQDYKKTDLIQTKVLIAGEALSSVVPDEQDYMIIDGVRYEIKLIMTAPRDACFVFTVRAV